ncbi:MAG TPA: AMIN domain-containing protein [Leptolyngbyaceae cyanobacterium]
MKQHQALAGLLMGGTAVLLASQPVWAAATLVTAVRVEQTNNGVQVILETQDGERPQIFTVNRGNAFVADITNAQLRLPQGNNLRKEKPGPGIDLVTVSQLDANSVRIIVTGTNNAPAGELTNREGEAITFNFGPNANNRAANSPVPNTLPSLANSPSTQANPTSPNTTAQTPTAQLPANQTPLVPNPQITYDRAGDPAPSAGTVQPVSPAPPFLPRAVAPPVGDIAVSELDPSGSVIDIGTNERIPRLLLRDAPVREVLTLLGRAANVNVVFIGNQGASAPGQAQQSGGQGQPPAGTSLDGTISLDIENEPLQDVFNTVLRITGLQANRQNRTVFVGSNLPEAASNLVVRSLRLNQVPVASAANFLTAQGAETQLPIERVQIQTIGEGAAARTVEIREPDIKVLRAQRGNGPLILSGLSVLADQRLNSITLVGDPRKVEIASAFLSQLDARRRQVAVNVKIIDVNLNNTDTVGTSFSFGIGGSFFSIDQGAATVNTGGVRPPTADQTRGSQLSPPVINSPITGDGFLDAQPEAPFGRSTAAPESFGSPLLQSGVLPRPPFGTNVNPFQPGVNSIDQQGRLTYSLPTLFQFPTRFLSALRAQVVSGNAKILTDPTLVIQEGETARVNLGQEVIVNQTVQQQGTGDNATFTVQTQKDTVGLVLQVQVNRIDDNGFVTLNINPSVTLPGTTSEIGGGIGGTVTISLLSRRDLQTGQIRMRDGQTLILSGIIQDQDRTTINKVPILGDIPIIGALFRSTSRFNQRNEVIALVTPQIIDDSGSAPFGYRYRPSPEVQQMLQRGGFNPPANNNGSR